MNGKRYIQWGSALLLAFGLAACQVKVPDGVLPDAKMEDVLYDYHIAKAMGEDMSRSADYERVLYVESVFKKHGITQADFDSSLVWYARYPDQLAKVYQRVGYRLKATRDGVKHLLELRTHEVKESLPGDSINVWGWQSVYELSGMPLDNKLTFSLVSDENFEERDTLRWNVCFRFLQHTPDTLHAPLMAMQIAYEKDTTIQVARQVLEEGLASVSLAADTLGKIKEVNGFIYFPMQQAASQAGLLLDHISLMRYHAKDSVGVVPTDSVKQVVDQPKKKEPAEKKVQTETTEQESVVERPASRPRSTIQKKEQTRKLKKLP